jgi:Zn-dependent peptidase ImmA (M78 family)
MKIPCKLKIVGQDFVVTKESGKKMKDCIGRCYPHANKIYISKNLTQDKANETLLHEVIHAIEQNLGLKMKEKQVNNLAFCLYSFLKENHVKWSN